MVYTTPAWLQGATKANSTSLSYKIPDLAKVTGWQSAWGSQATDYLYAEVAANSSNRPIGEIFNTLFITKAQNDGATYTIMNTWGETPSGSFTRGKRR